MATTEESVKATITNIQSRIDNELSPARAKLVKPIWDVLSKDRAPASSGHSHHGACEGGLLLHINCVLEFALGANAGVGSFAGKQLAPAGALQGTLPEVAYQDRVANWGNVTPQAILTVALLHDLNKVQDFNGNPCYVPNVLKSGKVSEAKPYEISKQYDPWQSLRSRLAPNDSALRILLPDETAEYGGPVVSSGLISLALAEQLSPGINEDLTSAERQAIIFHAGLYEKGDRTGLSGQEEALMIIIHFADMMASRLLF